MCVCVCMCVAYYRVIKNVLFTCPNTVYLPPLVLFSPLYHHELFSLSPATVGVYCNFFFIKPNVSRTACYFPMASLALVRNIYYALRYKFVSNIFKPRYFKQTFYCLQYIVYSVLQGRGVH